MEIDTENWENVRGPRGYEDNTEYLRARAKREAETKKRREEQLKQFKKLRGEIKEGE